MERITASAKASVPAVTAIGASTRVTLLGTIIGALGTKLSITAVTTLASAIIVTGAIAAVNDKTSDPNPEATANMSEHLAISSEGFEYPCELVDAYDPDDDGWQGVDGNNRFWVPIDLKKRLLGPPRISRSIVILPVEHWIELKFQGKIVDGPGNDIVLVEWDANGEQAAVYITDGAGNEYPLGIAMAGTSRQPSRTEIGFDISGISLPFEPCAVRIAGIRTGGWTDGFDLGSVRARIRRRQK